MIKVKFCGLNSSAAVQAAARAGAAYVGFVFFSKSPRHLSIEKARALAQETPAGIIEVALTVDATDTFLDQLTENVPLDLLQLHGRETPARVAEVKARYGLPVMKAVGVAQASDLTKIDHYAAVCDQLLIDAKPPEQGILPGGNGLAFDWRLIAGRNWPLPWMLAGGLSPETVPAALQMTATRQLDVSSGIETSPGVKDQGLMLAFMAAVQRHQTQTT